MTVLNPAYALVSHKTQSVSLVYSLCISVCEYGSVLCHASYIPTFVFGDKHLNARASIPWDWDNKLLALHLWVQAESGGSQRLFYGSYSLQQLCNDQLLVGRALQ